MRIVTRTSQSSRRGLGTLGRALLVFGVAFLVSMGAVDHEFTYDDHVIIEQNQLIRDLSNWSRILDSPYWSPLLAQDTRLEETFGLYRPLTILTFAVNYAFFGLDPLSYFLFNVLSHGLATLFFFLLLLRWGGIESGAAACWGALLFAVHPIHTEVVGGAVGRAEILAATLGFASLWSRARVEGVGTRGILLSVASLGAFFLALLAKENAVSILGLHFFAELLLRSRREAPPRKERTLFLVGVTLVFCGVWFGFRYPVTGHLATLPPDFLDNPIVELGFGQGLATALTTFARAVGLLFFPLVQSADYSYREIPPATWGAAGCLTGLAMVAGLFALGIWLWRRRECLHFRGVFVGLGIFAVTYFPVSNFVVTIGTIFAERVLYLPSAGFCAALGFGFSLLFRTGSTASGWGGRGNGVRSGLGLSVLVFLAYLSGVRSEVWKDDESLSENLARSSPQSARARYVVGNSLAEKGAEHWVGAEENLRRALWILPSYVPPRYVLARILEGQGRLPEAIRHYQALLALKPQSARIRTDFAHALLSMGRIRPAERRFVEALSIAPSLADAQSGLGRIRFFQGREALLSPGASSPNAPSENSGSPGSGAPSDRRARGRRLVLEAIGWFDRVLLLDSTRFAVRYDRAVARETLGQFDLAAADFLEVSRQSQGVLPAALPRFVVCRVRGRARGSVGQGGPLREEEVSSLLRSLGEAISLGGRDPGVRAAVREALSALEETGVGVERLESVRRQLGSG